MPADRSVSAIETELGQVRAEISRLLLQTGRQEKDAIQFNVGDRVYTIEDRSRMLDLLYQREEKLVNELRDAETLAAQSGTGGIRLQYGVVRALLFVLVVGMATPVLAQLAGTGGLQQGPITVGVASTPVLPASSSRSYLLLQNISDTPVFCSITGGAATLNQGIMLTPNGGGPWWDVVASVPRGAVNCISSAAGKVILVTEIH